jgi:hypothetical protein
VICKLRTHYCYYGHVNCWCLQCWNCWFFQMVCNYHLQCIFFLNSQTRCIHCPLCGFEIWVKKGSVWASAFLGD